LVEIPYTKGISTTQIDEAMREIGTTPDVRRARLRRLLGARPVLRFMEAHNGLTGLIVEKAQSEREDGNIVEFDGMWLSSLTDSTAKGKPDIEAVDVTSRMQTLNDILEVTTKPIIYDGDTGGKPEHFAFTVKTLERLGVSAVIIEDKVGLKKNSLFGTEVAQTQDTIEGFCHKIKTGIEARVTRDFMIVSRIESLILQQGMDDAVARAKAYVEAGTDAVMIHSREKDPAEILEFCEQFSKFDKKVPLIAVPSSYNTIYEHELQKAGVDIVIYANHLLRAAYPAMMETAQSILKHGRSHEMDKKLLKIKEILTLIPGGE
jgi:phosphoenolpyruvate phosphomutase / 2-hydroxyethylphosphonate cytidylyltransferase